ncbi:MAG: HIT family protein [Candidatus Xenobia bacterium]
MICVFCSIVAGTWPAVIVATDAHTVSFLDHRPLFPGHTLVVPRPHVVTLPDLPPDLIAPLFAQARRMASAMEQGLGAEGSFVALNNRVSQSVPHLHVHVVPRRRKDGLKGFFWPRHSYASPVEMEETAARLRTVLGGAG